MDKVTYHKAMAVLHMLMAKIHEAADAVEEAKAQRND